MLKKLKRNKTTDFKDINISFSRKGGIWAIYKLFNRYYIKSFFGPFFTFAFPVIILAILGSLMDVTYMFPGIVSMTAMSSGITGMPFAIMELKKSVLLKRIGASPVKASKFTVVIITYFTFMIFMSILWLMLWLVILHPTKTDMFGGLIKNNGLSFIAFIYGNVINIVLSLSIGFAIASIAKGEQQAQAIGMLIYFPSTFLAGQFISIDVISQNEVMNWISRIIPFRYTTMLVVSSWQGNNPFAIEAIYGVVPLSAEEIMKEIASGNLNVIPWKRIVVYEEFEPIIAYIIPYTFGTFFGIYSIKKFRWSAAR